MRLSFTQRIRQAAKIMLRGTLPPAPQRERIPPITMEEVAEAQQFFRRGKFFIFGHARSGTTLLMRLVRQHPEVHCSYQAHYFSRPPLLQSLVNTPEIEEWLVRRSNRWNRNSDPSAAILRAAGDFLLEREAAREGKSIVGDKSPNNLMNGKAVELMHAVYPDARLVFIVRDVRDAVISHRIQQFVDGVQFLSRADRRLREQITRDPQPYVTGKKSMYQEAGLRKAGLDWVQNVEETDQRGRELYGERYHALRFEDLQTRPVEEILALWEFLGADIRLPGLEELIRRELQQNPDAEYQQTKLQSVTALLPKGAAGYWRQVLTVRDQQILQEVCGETLKKWNYD